MIYPFKFNRLQKWACVAAACLVIYFYYFNFIKKASSKRYDDNAVHCKDPASKNCLRHFFPFDDFTDEKYFFMNVKKSIALPMRRKSLDSRSQECKSLSYTFEYNSPKVSIIMGFVNEHWSVLLRTAFSIISNSPANLLHEIIFVDDSSDLPFLQEPLTRYFELIPLFKTVPQL